jgi:DNA end-binding protein Ku
MRPIWKGAISFGLVFVPVKLYAATEKKDIKFNFLHEKCNTPVRYQRLCPYCGVEVPREEIVRGYEYEKGKYVVFKNGELDQIAPSGGKKNIEIMDFVDLVEIDPVYYEKAYYLVPVDGGMKAYELLKKAMGDTGKVAVARIVMRSRETLAVLRVNGNSLIMNTMHYPDEIRQAGVLPEMNYQVNLHENEVKMAVNLVSSLSADFRPEKYTDTYRQGLIEVIQAKIAGETVKVPAEPEAGKVVDLMEALKASIELAEKERDRQVQSGKKSELTNNINLKESVK